MQRIIKYSFSFQRPKLHIYDKGGRSGLSGIRATIYGATGLMGQYVGGALGDIGSELVFPHNHIWHHDDELKELKLCQQAGQVFLVPQFDFDNSEMIDWTMKNSNVVINLVGPRYRAKSRAEFEYVNITIPRRIAQAAAKNPNVIRLIHFSNAGANPHAQSMDLQTKYIGEQEVLDAFPHATIIRPSVICAIEDYFTLLWYKQKNYFYNFNIVPDDCSAKRQPIFALDVAYAVLNSLKIPEACGETYELGGPHVYTLLECYEMMHNIVQRPPTLAHLDRNLLLKVANLIPNWRQFGVDMILKHNDDMIVTGKHKTIDDLFVKPLSFPAILHNIFFDVKARYNGQNADYER